MNWIRWAAGVRLSVCLAMLLVPLCLGAQEIAQLPVLVDGSKTPELIPDDLAYNHFILVISMHLNPTPEEIRLRDLRLSPIGLTAQDSQAVVGALKGVREELESIDEAAAGPDVDQTPLRARWESVMWTTRDRLRHALSGAGLKRSDSFIRDHVKPFIVIYGSN